MKIAVTGGTGFLGRETMRQLANAGHNVFAISRGITPKVNRTGDLHQLRCDINDSDALASAFEKCDVVVHCAALSAPWGRAYDFHHQNAEGTASVVKAAEAAGVRRLIHVSSSSVCFTFSDRIGVREDEPLPRPVNAYAQSKQAAEREAARFQGELFVLRPRGIYGRGDKHLLPRLLRVMKTQRLPLLRGGAALVDITHVAVVADAIGHMVNAHAASADTYNISHGEPISIRDLVGIIGDGLAIDYRWKPLPMPLAFGAARVLEVLARLDWQAREPLVTRYGLGLFGYSHTLDISKAARDLGWTPRMSLREGLQDTLANDHGALS